MTSPELGSGQVDFHEDRPIIHFASPREDIEHALLAHKLRATGFETTERMPS